MDELNKIFVSNDFSQSKQIFALIMNFLTFIGVGDPTKLRDKSAPSKARTKMRARQLHAVKSAQSH